MEVVDRNAEKILRRGVNLANSGNFGPAAEVLSRALPLRDGSPLGVQILLELGHVFSDKLEHERSLRVFDLAISAIEKAKSAGDQRDPILLARAFSGRADAREAGTAFLSRTPPWPQREAFSVPMIISDYEKALEIYGSLPDNAWGRIEIARIYNRLGILELDNPQAPEYSISEDYFKRALAIHQDPKLVKTKGFSDIVDYPGIISNLANILSCKGNHEEAIKIYQGAIDIYDVIITNNPDHPWPREEQARVLRNLAHVHLETGNYTESAERYGQEIALLEDLVLRDNRYWLRNLLVRAYLNRAKSLETLEKLQSSAV